LEQPVFFFPQVLIEPFDRGFSSVRRFVTNNLPVETTSIITGVSLIVEADAGVIMTLKINPTNTITGRKNLNDLIMNISPSEI
jgi:hypothetical protein